MVQSKICAAASVYLEFALNVLLLARIPTLLIACILGAILLMEHVQMCCFKILLILVTMETIAPFRITVMGKETAQVLQRFARTPAIHALSLFVALVGFVSLFLNPELIFVTLTMMLALLTIIV